jgi:hypothetical protein
VKLFLVRCHGMQTSTGGQIAWGQAFVAAEDPTSAYRKLREHLDKGDIGFARDREMLSIELVADSYEYPECCIRFYP